MLWRCLDTAPIDIDTGVEPAIARAVAGALAAHAVPLADYDDGPAHALVLAGYPYAQMRRVAVGAAHGRCRRALRAANRGSAVRLQARRLHAWRAVRRAAPTIAGSAMRCR